MKVYRLTKAMEQVGTICRRCGVDQKYPSVLKRHELRKTPCMPILFYADLSIESQVKAHKCKYCGRTFTTATSMHRHTRTRCKIANSDEGMEKLLDHTLRCQLEDQSIKIDMLTELIKQMASGQNANATAARPATQLIEHANATTAARPATQLIEHANATAARPAARPATQLIEHVGQLNNGPVVNNNTINIHAWDGDRRIGVDLAHIMAAFAENAKLQEYARLGDHELVDPGIAPPYVTELFMDLTKRAHADPAARNVYLNPRRADQVLVHKKNGAWEVLPLASATRLLFDGVAQGIHRATMTNEERGQLPLEAQNALSMAGLLYDDEPDEYARRAKAPMAAHLSLAEITRAD